MNRKNAIEELGFFLYESEDGNWMMVDEEDNIRFATIHERILLEEAMKDQYTAADMASAAAQGFRDGIKRAADICHKIYMLEKGSPNDMIAMACKYHILRELKVTNND